MRPDLAHRIAVPLLAALVAGCGGGGGSTSTTTPAPQRATPVAASVAQLRSLSRSVGHDVFWAGPKRGFTYELSRTTDGSIYIRYLPPGVPVGAAAADFLSVGTYPKPNAFATIQEARKRPGESITPLDHGGVAVQNQDRPQSVYFGYPGADVFVEVYDSSAKRALSLVKRHAVRPIR